MLRRERAVCEGNNGANLSGAPSPPAVSNNAASLNSCIRPSAITSRDGLRLHCFHQVRERLRYFHHRPGVTLFVFFPHARFGAVEQTADIAAVFDNDQQSHQPAGNYQWH